MADLRTYTSGVMRGMAMPGVSAIIVNYNLKKDTLQCLDSLQQTRFPSLTCIVVDNGSTDDSVEAIHERFPETTILQTGENSGYAGGVNCGIEYALRHGAEYLLILNNDIVADPDLVDALVGVSQKNPQIGVVCPKVYYYDQKDVLWSAGARIDMRWGRPSLIGRNERDRGQYDSERLVDYLDGCAFLASRQMCEQVGLMDPIYFVYFEDSDWSIRMRHAGFKIVYTPAARAWHKVSATSQPGGNRSPFQAYYHIRNHLLFLSRYGRITLLKQLELAAMVGYNLLKALVNYQRDVSIARIRGIADYYRGRFGKTLSL